MHRVDGKFDHLVEFGSEVEVRALAPDMAGLARLPGRGVIATAHVELGSEFDLVSRFFAPAVGVSEVSQSPACAERACLEMGYLRESACPLGSGPPFPVVISCIRLSPKK